VQEIPEETRRLIPSYEAYQELSRDAWLWGRPYPFHSPVCCVYTSQEPTPDERVV
jgi:hypothetical protein